MTLARFRPTTSIYKTIDRLSMTIDVSKPPGYQAEIGVAVIHFHGGFLVVGEKTTFPPNWLINASHKQGWAYTSPSYRLLPETDGLSILEDAIEATCWVYNNISKRIIVAGSSAGGYLALATAADPRCPPVSAVLSIYGMLDFSSRRYIEPGTGLGGNPPRNDTIALISEIKNEGTLGEVIDGYPFPENPQEDKRFQWITALHYEALYVDVLTRLPGLSERIRTKGVGEIPENFRALFPSTFRLDAKLPPTALLHGYSDPFVDFEQSWTVYHRLKSLGVKTILEKATGHAHAFDVREVPEDIDIDDTQSTQEKDFYPNLRRVMAFLGEAVCK